MNRWLRPALLLFLILNLFAVPPLLAQDEATPTPPPEATSEPLVPKIHVVASGETLTTIAALYDVTIDEIMFLNNLSNADAIYEGQELVIPGAEGDRIPAFYTVQVGEQLADVAQRYNTDVEAIVALNSLVSSQLVAGQRIGLLSGSGSTEPLPLTGRFHVVTVDETLLSVSMIYGLQPAELAAANHLAEPAVVFPGQRLLIPDAETSYQPLAGYWESVEISPLPLVPGEAVKIEVTNALDGEPTGQLGEQPLRFSQTESGWLAIVGIDPYAPVGYYDLELAGSGSRPWPTLRETVLVEPFDYGTQAIVVPDTLSDILDLDLRAAEDAYLAPFFDQYSGPPRWDGPFQYPSTTQQTTSPYGVLRSYNGGPYLIYHSGIDFPVPTGGVVFAPAPGTVVFAEELRVRGNMIILDHGGGVMSAYFHLSRIDVAVGDDVPAGAQIGLVGNTGLSSGAHLHWDIRVNNVPVNPLQWLSDWVP